MTVEIAISGAGGRMGEEITRQAAANPDFQVALAFERAGHPRIGETLAGGAIAIKEDTALATVSPKVLIDFTHPQATLSLAAHCLKNKIGMVIGTTGFTDEELSQLREHARHIPLLWAQNMSIGVNVLYTLAEFAARQLGAGRLGGGYDMEIFEAHHRHKKDAPSGTALRLGERLAKATGGDLATDGTFARHGRTDDERQAHHIGFSVVRGGDIVGEHRITFAGAGEQIEITHRSTTRANYAAGALRAARFIATAAPGFYDGMERVINPD